MPLCKPVGSLWLKEHYQLNRYSLTHCSYIGNNESIEVNNKGHIEQTYGIKYSPSADTPLKHLEFSLKYDHLNLDFLKELFQKIPKGEIQGFIEASPSGKYARKIGFLYEFLTTQKLELNKIIAGNYTDLLDAEKYITGNTVKCSRWRMNNNLLGTATYCPVVRRTTMLNELLKQDITEKIERLKNGFPPDIFRSATNYLYNRETRSSYEIEKENPSPKRLERFISLLMKAGTEKQTPMLEETRLIKLQNAIVDPRFAATSFRNFQNYIGQTLPGYNEMIHYICPPPEMLISLMDGLKLLAEKTDGIYPEIRAALIAFGFVFIHPFEDGNGRIHRFLIHDMLVHDRIVPHGLIIPVSAHMLNNMKDYDAVLENYSKPLMLNIKYNLSNKGEVVVINKNEIEGYYRYPDLTDQCIYLTATIHATVNEDMPGELAFIQRYDETKNALQQITDMPDKDINQMILFLHQNKGRFPKRRRNLFSKLTDDEIMQMETAYREIFGIETL